MPQKLLIAFVAVVVLIVMIAGISSVSRKNDGAAEESSDIVDSTQTIIVPSEMPERISMEIPAGFTETASSYYDKYYVLNDASVIVTGEPLNMNSQDTKSYGEIVKSQYQQSVDDFVLLAEEETVVADVTCCLYEFTYAIKSADAVQEMQCITAVAIKDGQVYIVTCKSHRDSFMNYQQSFRTMIESIRIADADPVSSGSAAASQTQTQTSALPVT